MFKIGTLADWFGVGLLEGIRESERCGAEGVQVYAAGELDPMNATAEQIKKIRDTARDCRQEIVALCGELGGFGLEIAEDNNEKLKYLKRTVDLGLEFDCHIVTTHVGVIPKDRSVPRYKVMKEACMEIGEYAAERGSYLAIETGPEKLKTLKAFIDDCGTKGVAVNYDPANIAMVTDDDEVEGVLTCGSSIVHTHAKDGLCLEYVDSEWYYHMFAKGGLEWARSVNYAKQMPLGEGGVHWIPYLKALRTVGYDGFLTIEREVENGAEDIRNAVVFLRDVIAKL
jgi:sugar phosphate isomerase/epimerase